MDDKQKLLILIMNMQSKIDSDIDDLFNYLLNKLDTCGRIISTMEIK